MTKPKRCKACGGTGVAKDWRAVGAEARRARERLGLSIRAMARSAGCSAMMLSDLERGNRGWDGPVAKKVAHYLKLAARTRLT